VRQHGFDFLLVQTVNRAPLAIAANA